MKNTSKYPRLLDVNGFPLDLRTGDGANGTITFTHKDTSATAVDITGWAITCTGYTDPSQFSAAGDVFTAISASIVSGTAGTFSVDFSSLNLTTEQTIYLMFGRTVSTKRRTLAVYVCNVLA